jgi:2-polyprenyl-3-methyl-5-hydroxy-6-metoxy-1,4-benzoquinol methylase
LILRYIGDCQTNIIIVYEDAKSTSIRQEISIKIRLCKIGCEKVIFNLWYFKKPPWDTGVSPPELIGFIATHPPGRALDLGCGTGTNVITLAQHGWQVTGVDFARKAIVMGKRKVRQAGVNADLRVGDVTKPTAL